VIDLGEAEIVGGLDGGVISAHFVIVDCGVEDCRKEDGEDGEGCENKDTFGEAREGIAAERDPAADAP